MLVTTYKAIQLHNPEHHDPYFHHHDDLKPHTFMSSLLYRCGKLTCHHLPSRTNLLPGSGACTHMWTLPWSCSTDSLALPARAVSPSVIMCLQNNSFQFLEGPAAYATNNWIHKKVKLLMWQDTTASYQLNKHFTLYALFVLARAAMVPAELSYFCWLWKPVNTTSTVIT